jgi:hypothetical protein
MTHDISRNIKMKTIGSNFAEPSVRPFFGHNGNPPKAEIIHKSHLCFLPSFQSNHHGYWIYKCFHCFLHECKNQSLLPKTSFELIKLCSFCSLSRSMTSLRKKQIWQHVTCKQFESWIKFRTTDIH